MNIPGSYKALPHLPFDPKGISLILLPTYLQLIKRVESRKKQYEQIRLELQQAARSAHPHSYEVNCALLPPRSIFIRLLNNITYIRMLVVDFGNI